MPNDCAQDLELTSRFPRCLLLVLSDWRRERRIRLLGRELIVAAPEARPQIWKRQRAEILARSDRQIARMERSWAFRLGGSVDG